MPNRFPANDVSQYHRVSPGMASFAVVVIAVTLLYGTLSPKPDAGSEVLLFPHVDKVLHFLGWFALGLAAALISRTAHWHIFGWGACTVFGLFTECGQIFVVGRHFEVLDCLADSFGSAVGFLTIGYDTDS